MMSPELASAVRMSVGVVGGARITGVGDDRAGQGSGRVVGGDADGVMDQFGVGVQHLLVGVDLGERKPGPFGSTFGSKRVC